LVLVQWAGFTIKSQPISAILTVITTKLLPRLAQCVDDRQQTHAAISEPVFDVGWLTTVFDPLDQSIAFHITKPINQRPTADRKETINQFSGATRSAGQIPDDQQRPLVTNQL
jgi:hypothetical protein